MNRFVVILETANVNNNGKPLDNTPVHLWHYIPNYYTYRITVYDLYHCYENKSTERTKRWQENKNTILALKRHQCVNILCRMFRWSIGILNKQFHHITLGLANNTSLDHTVGKETWLRLTRYKLHLSGQVGQWWLSRRLIYLRDMSKGPCHKQFMSP